MTYFLASSDDEKPKNYFNGIAFSNDSIVLSLEGLNKYVSEGNDILDLTDGRYALHLNLDGLRFFTTDRAGQDCWFYYKDDYFWAVSNSLYAIAEKIKKVKGKISLREAGLLFYNVNHSLGGQPCSEYTMVEGVKILPKDKYLILDNNFFHINDCPAVKKIEVEEEYIESLKEYITTWTSRIKYFTNNLEAGCIRADITGGMDSRIILGLTNNENVKNIKYSSNKKWTNDYSIALLLSKIYDFSIDNSEISKPRSIPSEQALNLYKYGNAGIYKSIYWPKHTKPFPSLHLHGAGGGNIRGVGGSSAWKVIHRLKKDFPTIESFELFKDEYLNWFKRNDIDYNTTESTIIHYRNFRSRFHFGRNWYRSLTNPLLTPLSSLKLEALSDYLIKSGRDPEALQFDIMFLCDDILPFLPYDSELKGFNKKTISSSFDYISKVSFTRDILDHKVYGELSSPRYVEPSECRDIDINNLASKEMSDYIKEFKFSNVNLNASLLQKNKLDLYSAIPLLKLSYD